MDQEQTSQPSQKKIDCRAKGIDHTKTVEYYHQGLTHTEIAKLQGCDHSNITRVLQRYGITKKYEDYKTHRADILAGLQDRLLCSITDQEIQKTPAVSRITGAAILYDKERLERGQATSVNVNVLVDVLEAIRSRD